MPESLEYMLLKWNGQKGSSAEALQREAQVSTQVENIIMFYVVMNNYCLSNELQIKLEEPSLSTF